jgi:hypothetical protein
MQGRHRQAQPTTNDTIPPASAGFHTSDSMLAPNCDQSMECRAPAALPPLGAYPGHTAPRHPAGAAAHAMPHEPMPAQQPMLGEAPTGHGARAIATVRRGLASRGAHGALELSRFLHSAAQRSDGGMIGADPVRSSASLSKTSRLQSLNEIEGLARTCLAALAMFLQSSQVFLWPTWPQRARMQASRSSPWR